MANFRFRNGFDRDFFDRLYNEGQRAFPGDEAGAARYALNSYYSNGKKLYLFTDNNTPLGSIDKPEFMEKYFKKLGLAFKNTPAYPSAAERLERASFKIEDASAPAISAAPAAAPTTVAPGPPSPPSVAPAATPTTVAPAGPAAAPVAPAVAPAPYSPAVAPVAVPTVAPTAPAVVPATPSAATTSEGEELYKKQHADDKNIKLLNRLRGEGAEELDGRQMYLANILGPTRQAYIDAIYQHTSTDESKKLIGDGELARVAGLLQSEEGRKKLSQIQTGNGNLLDKLTAIARNTGLHMKNGEVNWEAVASTLDNKNVLQRLGLKDSALKTATASDLYDLAGAKLQDYKGDEKKKPRKAPPKAARHPSPSHARPAPYERFNSTIRNIEQGIRTTAGDLKHGFEEGEKKAKKKARKFFKDVLGHPVYRDHQIGGN